MTFNANDKYVTLFRIREEGKKEYLVFATPNHILKMNDVNILEIRDDKTGEHPVIDIIIERNCGLIQIIKDTIRMVT